MTITETHTASTRTVAAPSLTSLLVHVQPGRASARRVEIAARLARTFGARLIGLGAETVEPLLASDPLGGAMSAELVDACLEQVTADLKAAEADFRKASAGAEIEWRAVQDYPHRALARAARAADLIVASPRGREGSSRAADPAELVMRAGRPVLLVPEDAAPLHAKTVLVAWKDTREARRAVADALPFMVRAEEVVVHAACAEDTVESALFEVEDVCAALGRHGVNARASVAETRPDAAIIELLRAAEAAGADLLVAGAYGHSRFSEWVFGGVTDELIHRPDRYVLLTH